MLFHVHHRHDEKTCPAHNAEAVSASFGAVLPTLAENGVNVVGAWVDPPGHDFFFVLETDDYEALVEGLRPIIPSGSATIQPVGRGHGCNGRETDCRRELNQHCSPRWPSGSSTDDRKDFTTGLSYRPRRRG